MSFQIYTNTINKLADELKVNQDALADKYIADSNALIDTYNSAVKEAEKAYEDFIIEDNAKREASLEKEIKDSKKLLAKNVKKK
jgi:hypothetical protein